MTENETNLNGEGKYRHNRSDLIEALAIDEESAIRVQSEVMVMVQMKMTPSRIIERLENNFEGHTLYFGLYIYGALVENHRMAMMPPPMIFHMGRHF